MSEKHHYVPVWYQKRFLPQGKYDYYYLDLKPQKTVVRPGLSYESQALQTWGPKKCFYEEDLYTTRLFGRQDNSIERFLFGDIDRVGPLSIDAFLKEDWNTVHKLYWRMFEYIDAQKLRTPKGLAWIKAQGGAQTQSHLMLLMQQIRQMHCVMWAEGLIEIVSAENASVKFIVSDHPVVVYNPACFPNSAKCQFPNDPLTSWIGTQTFFPLGLNHCLIFTNLEYAREPTKAKLTTPRTNARYFEPTMVRYDDALRGRQLSDDDVIKINYIIKMRANKFIAAASLEWLYPEKILKNRMWNKIGKVLLPNRELVPLPGGEIYVGGADGELAWYQDEFGRTSKNAAEHKMRSERAEAMRKHTMELLKEHFKKQAQKDKSD